MWFQKIWKRKRKTIFLKHYFNHITPIAPIFDHISLKFLEFSIIWPHSTCTNRSPIETASPTRCTFLFFFLYFSLFSFLSFFFNLNFAASPHHLPKIYLLLRPALPPWLCIFLYGKVKWKYHLREPSINHHIKWPI